jgi:hypothetical protein
MLAVALAALAGQAAPAAACDRPIAVEVAPAPAVPGERIARGVRPVAAWALTTPEPTLHALARFDLADGHGQTADGRWLDWESVGARPSHFRLACSSPERPAGVLPPPPSPPRIRGYRYVGSRPLAGSAFRAVGLWRSSEGPRESLVVVFDPSTRTMRAPYVVLVRTPEPLGAVSASGRRGDLDIRIAAVTHAEAGQPVRLAEWAWRDGKAYGVPLD